VVPTEDQVRQELADGHSYTDIMEKYKINPTRISAIVHGKDISQIAKIKNQTIDAENELKEAKKKVSDCAGDAFFYCMQLNAFKKQIEELHPWIDVVEKIKKMGGGKPYVLGECFDLFNKCGISDEEIHLFVAQRELDSVRAEHHREVWERLEKQTIASESIP
jgi:hypothetical protein